MSDGAQTDKMKARAAQELVLALMGDGHVSDDCIAEGATWQNGPASLIGRDAIIDAIKDRSTRITIDEVVTHGKAAAVSGKLRDDRGQTRLFCHMIRYTNTSARQVASIVSFEHSVRAS